MLSVKKDFPIFKEHPEMVYLDSAATALKPQAVIDAVSEYYRCYSANVHRGLYDLSEQATSAYEAARETVRGFINANSAREIVFTRGTTEAINVVARTWGKVHVKQGDEIVVSILEHHSNLVPWQMLAKETGAKLVFIECDEKGILKLEKLSSLISRRTKIIALSHVSNALGTITRLRPLIQKAYAGGIKVLIDAAQSLPHMPIDVQYLGCDFLAFSGHKLGGPTGVGVLYAKESLLQEMPPFMVGGGMIKEVHATHSSWNEIPWKFEAGTPPIAEAIGLAAAVEYLQGLGMSNVRDHEKVLMQYAIEKLAAIDGVTLFGPSDSAHQSGIISFGLKGIHPHDIAALLNEQHIAIRAGHHCCMPLMERLKVPATARASFYIYNQKDDVDALVRGIVKVQKVFA